jgi:hypothetical protein
MSIQVQSFFTDASARDRGRTGQLVWYDPVNARLLVMSSNLAQSWLKSGEMLELTHSSVFPPIDNRDAAAILSEVTTKKFA